MLEIDEQHLRYHYHVHMHTSEAEFSPSLSAGKTALERPPHRTDCACRPPNGVILVTLRRVRFINCTVHFI